MKGNVRRKGRRKAENEPKGEGNRSVKVAELGCAVAACVCEFRAVHDDMFGITHLTTAKVVIHQPVNKFATGSEGDGEAQTGSDANSGLGVRGEVVGDGDVRLQSAGFEGRVSLPIFGHIFLLHGKKLFFVKRKLRGGGVLKLNGMKFMRKGTGVERGRRGVGGVDVVGEDGGEKVAIAGRAESTRCRLKETLQTR